MSIHEKYINKIIEIEGGYVDHPNDSGGATCWGITERTARLAGYTGHMRNMPREFAFALYKRDYWDVIRGDDLEGLSPGIAFEVMDTCVNRGRHWASVYLQEALNCMNWAQRLYPDIVVDGKIGDKTISALRGYIQSRGDIQVLLTALNCQQGNDYIKLAKAREKDEDFVFGWFKNRVVLSGEDNNGHL